MTSETPPSDETNVMILNLPEELVEGITKHLDLCSVLTFRGVCRGFRDYIDHVIPPSSMRGIAMEVYGNGVDLLLNDPTVALKKVQYPNNDQLQLPVDVFWADLRTILTHQKDPLEYLEVSLAFPKAYGEAEKLSLIKIHFKFLKRLQQLLKSMKTLIPVKTLRLNVLNQKQIMLILPFVDAENLKKISIIRKKGEGTKFFNLNKVYKTEQWKSAKELDTFRFVVKGNLERFAHFKRCSIRVMEFSTQLMKDVKKNFLHAPNLEHIKLHIEKIVSLDNIMRTADETFDRHYKTDGLSNWWCTTAPEDPEYALSVESCLGLWLVITRVKLSDIPIVSRIGQ